MLRSPASPSAPEMSQSNEINFGPVFMRGRKPAPVNSKPAPGSTSSAPQNQLSHPVLKPTNHTPTLGSFSPTTHTSSLPLPKSFSAAVSPGKDSENRPHSNGFPSNTWEANLTHPDPSPHINGQQLSAPADYSRETLLNLYSEDLASKLPPDLEINHPAVSIEFVGPPLALIEMSEVEKELFAGPFNSEKRSAANKLQPHHNIHDPTSGTSQSPETIVHHGLPNSKLSVGGPVKLGKHNSTERFNSLGIQGGVLAGVASPSHSHPSARRRNDNELDANESPRRFQRSDDSVPPWTATPRDRRTRDLAPPSDGKWKRGVSFEDKTQTSQDSPGGANLKYSVLDKMREKAAGNLEPPHKDAHQPSNDPPQEDHQPAGASQLSSHVVNESSNQMRQAGDDLAASRASDENHTASLPMQTESENNQHVSNNGPETSAGSGTQPTDSDLNPENIAWQYRDPSGTVQGPFTAFQMQEWYKATFFRDDLLVKRVIDVAFETLETLILRVGDRDRPFLSRPPPALPPNLPLPQAHSHNHHPPVSQPSPRLPVTNLLDQASSLPPQAESVSAVDSMLSANPSSAPSQHIPMSTPDPWNGIAPGASPLPHPGNIPASTPLTSGAGWNSSLPAFSAHPNIRSNDFVINDGLVEFNNVNLLNNGLMPNLNHSFMSTDTLRFLQHVQHPALSMAAANAYPFLPMPPPPNFGQIPSMSHLSNSAMNPILAAQLHAQVQLMHSPYLFNNPAPDGGEGVDPQAERTSHDNLTPHLHHVDPWQASSQPPNDPSLGHNDRTMAPMPPNQNQSMFPPTPDEGAIHEPTAAAAAAHQKNNDVRQSVPHAPGQQFSELKLSDPDETHAKAESQPVSTVNSEKRSTMTSPVTEHLAPTVTSSSSNVSPGAVEKESAVPPVVTAQSAPIPTELARDGLPSQSSPSTGEPGSTTISDPTTTNPSWRNVTQPTTTKPPSVSRNSMSITSSAPKSSGKVVVMSKAQQDEQERRTASIQKAQLQLKEAQAVERAAREASEAAAAATAASFSTPAPWLKEEKSGSNLSLTEIQAIEAKQLEKRRSAEKQAAANRAMAEHAMAAERAMKATKEALPAASNWAATASSPTKQSVSAATVWGSKESEAPTAINGPKQSMKQIQEEEARKKNLALQQQQQSRPAAAAKTVGGYAGTVASTKPAVSGPWSVVGAKSKVIAPPAGVRGSVGAGAGISSGAVRVVTAAGPTASKPVLKAVPAAANKATNKSAQPASASANNSSNTAVSNPTANLDGPPPASPEFMKWLREALRGMNNVDDFVKMLLDFPVNPDESVLEIVSDSVYAGSATLDGRRFAKEFNARRIADVASRANTASAGGRAGGVGGKTGSSSALMGGSSGLLPNGAAGTKKVGYFMSPANGTAGTMADAVKLQPAPKNDGWGFAVVGAKKKKK
ncbi:hypothetical protein PCANC_17654 [Puccinia coronata f. sp. avenae]|uniref:GYF domain-containing protein n=1 Tax=Puccinia coronata f. sp. avenae TaxID=200324 RepID=A0A2N5SFM7_9BASI|nr:hypothetical protein PCANC_17654 [Puccinia coronata f. sp. avenae]